MRKKLYVFLLCFVFCILFSLGIYSSNHKIQDTGPSIQDFWGDIIKDDWLVNDDTLGGCKQESPAITATKFGYVLVWIDFINGHDTDVYSCRFDSNGVIIGSVFLVNDDTSGSSQSSPAIQADSSGNFVIVWVDSRNKNRDIYGQRYDAVGIPLNSNFRINDDLSGKWQYTPRICISPDGDFAVAWRDDRGSAPDIYCQIYDNLGSKIGDNFIVNDDGLAGAFQCHPDIARTGNAEFAIVWLDTRDGCAIYCQRYTSFGTPIDSNFKVTDNTGNASMQVPIISSNSINKTIVWEDYREHSSYPNIYCQRYDSLWTIVDTNFRVNDDTMFARQEIPYTGMDLEGNVLVVWSDKRESAEVPNVYGQRYDKLGNPEGENFKINTNPAGKQWQVHSILGMRRGGEFIVLWEDNSGKDTELVGQKYASDGTAVGTSFSMVSDKGTRNQKYPGVAMCPDGNFVITWGDERLNSTAIFAQRYDADGEEVDFNFQVNEDTLRVAYSPGVATDSAGNFVITWFYRKVSKDVLYFGDIYARKYNNSGTPIGSEFKVNLGPDAPRAVPQTAMDKAGNFVVVWEDARNDTKRPDIYARKYFADCSPVDSSFGVNQFLGKERSEAPAIAMSEQGDFIVVWHEGKGDVGLFDIYGQRFDSSGDSVGVNFQISDDPIDQNQQMNPSVAMRSEGSFVVLWEDTREGNRDIYGQKYENWLSVGSNFRINYDTSSAVQETPSVTINPVSGGFIASWTDYRNPCISGQIMAQEFDSSCTPVGDNFQINNSDKGYRMSSGEGIASCGDKVVFAWTDNRRVKGWDIYAKLMKWEAVQVEERFTIHDSRFTIYPNPAMKKLSIKYGISTSGVHKISIYDKSGRMVKEFTLSKKESGMFSAQLDISDFSSGVYFIKFKGPDVSIIDKIILLR